MRRRARCWKSSTSTWRRRASCSNGAPGTFNLARYVTLPFLEKIDPAIKHKLIAAGDVTLPEPQGTGNANPDRKWCTGRTALICIEFDL